MLHGTEKIARSWQCQAHAAQFPKRLVPFLDGQAFLVERNAGEDRVEAINTVWRQVYCHGGGVDNPAQDLFDSVPGCISLPKFL